MTSHRSAPRHLMSLLAIAVASLPAPAAALTLGRYCSMTWPTGGWALVLHPNLTQDPCDEIKKKSDPGGTVQRAGLYSVDAKNNVVVRCGPKGGWVGVYQGVNDGPFKAAYKSAQDNKQKDCVFTGAARELPLFNSPFPSKTSFTHATGFDFARGPYKTLDLKNEFGQPGASTAAAIVDWKAEDKSGGGYIEDHDGQDLIVGAKTEVRVVAAGTVLAARFRDVSNVAGCTYTDPKQGEVWIEHALSGKTGKVTTSGAATPYDEKFVTFYAHLSSIDVKQGDTVTQGQKLGLSGNTGCSNQAHLHFGAFKTTNTAAYYAYPTTINSDFSKGHDQNSSNLWQVAIEPSGWYAAVGFDPWSWKAYPDWGALSVNLWSSGQAPAMGNW